VAYFKVLSQHLCTKNLSNERQFLERESKPGPTVIRSKSASQSAANLDSQIKQALQN
jgi:hypothetical protein